MAKKPTVTKAGSTTVVTVPAAAPIAKRRSSSRRSSPRRKSSRRRSGGGSRRGGGNLGDQMVAHGVGGFVVGYIEKSFPQLPSLPVVGRKGAIAIAAYFLRGKHPIVADVGKAAAAIAGYELGTTGKITGIDGDEDEVLAAQM